MKFFFVSTNVARVFNSSNEATIVLSYRSSLPGHYQDRWHTKLGISNDITTASGDVDTTVKAWERRILTPDFVSKRLGTIDPRNSKAKRIVRYYARKAQLQYFLRRLMTAILSSLINLGGRRVFFNKSVNVGSSILRHDRAHFRYFETYVNPVSRLVR